MDTFKVEDIIFATRAEAEEALFKLEEQAKTYGYVSMSELYDMAGLAADYGASQYIWVPHSFKDSHVCRVRDGFIISLPLAVRKPMPATPKVTYRSYSPPKPKVTPKPLTISVDVSVDDLDDVLAKVFQYAQTVTDREVKIDIC